jgi:hypothetical protein
MFPSRCIEASRKLLPCALVLPMLLAGCAGSERSNRSAIRAQERSTLPSFLEGPAALLLTNEIAFSARLTAGGSSRSSEVDSLSGQFLAQGSRLVFSPAAGGVYFIWDVANRAGYIVDETMQAYAPITSNIQVTNLVIDPERMGPISEKVDGHPCKRTDVTLALSGGADAQFTVWRATDLKGWPVRIKALNGMPRFTLDLSGFRQETFPREIFLPPDGFTKYADAETMRAELVTRKAALKKKSMSPVPEEFPAASRGQPPPQSQGR